MSLQNQLFETIAALVMRHSPSGVEDEIDPLIVELFADVGVEMRSDAAGNLVGKIAGSGGGTVAITAHKDEIGALVTAVEEEGRLKLRKFSGAFPWVYGEGVVDILGDKRCVSGILSFGSRHVSHASPQHGQQQQAPVKWEDVWVETKLDRGELDAAGIRPGSRVVVGKHRKQPFRLGNHIASYTLDNKASIAVLLEMARRVRTPRADIYLVASAKEEIGALGALHFTQNQQVDALIALEIAPLSSEYTIKDGPDPVLLVEDSWCLYDEGLNAAIRKAAEDIDMPLQLAVVTGFGSDSSVAMKHGHIARGACLGFPTANTHGYEIAHLGALENLVSLLEQYCNHSCFPTEVDNT